MAGRTAGSIGRQYIRQQRDGCTSGSRMLTVHQAADGRENSRQHRAAVHQTEEGRLYIRQQMAGRTAGSIGRQYIMQQRAGCTSGSRRLTVHEAAEGWENSGL